MHHDEDPIPLDMTRRIVQKSARDAIKAHQGVDSGWVQDSTLSRQYPFAVVA